jgi:hypothetical protein
MSTPGTTLLEAATAVASLGAHAEDIALLDDDSVIAGMRLLRQLDDAVQPYKLWLSAAIAARSTREAGYDGLARRSGAATPAVLIQTLSGTSLTEAAKLANLGAMMVDADDLAAPVMVAATTGEITLDAADAIRRGLGSPDAAVNPAQLKTASARLVADAAGVPVEVLLRLARQARAELDIEAVERGEKEHFARRSVRIFEKDDLYRGSWALTAEDGGLEINTALKLLLASSTDGPRFVPSEPKGQPSTDAPEPDDSSSTPMDERTSEQILADGFVQIFLNGLHADPSLVPGAGRAAVRVLVDAGDLIKGGGAGLLQDNLSAISFGKLEEYLCEGDTVQVVVGDSGDIINFGREQRTFTRKQREALGVRDGGCRFPGCQKPPSWCEAHHVLYWKRDFGPTDLENGLLLCRYHHMLIHNNGWTITRRDGTFWLTKPPGLDPGQVSIEMPSKNPILAKFRERARERQRELAPAG